jgi:predicted NBD/HSP70 family sugar kinase
MSRLRAEDDPTRRILQRADHLDHALFAVGIELLPYELVGVLTDFDGTPRGARRWPLPRMDVETVVEQVARLARYLVDTSLGLDLPNPRVCLGLQLGGPVDTGTGMVRYYCNSWDRHTTRMLPWQDVPLVDLVQAATGCATVLENDARAYAAYEQKLGLGLRTASFALVLIRDGVGGAVVIGHRQLPLPLEFGHIPVWPQGRECDCGTRGCVESQAGRRAIRAVVSEETGLENVDSFERAVEIAEGGDERAGAALRAFRAAGQSIARGLATVLTLFGPLPVVLYGPEPLVSPDRGGPAADCFMAEVRRFDEHTFRGGAQCTFQAIPLSPHHPDRGAHGAALTALHRQFFVPLGSR